MEINQILWKWKGVEYDAEKALALLKEAAAEGCEEAKCDLALAYLFDLLNIGKDEEKGKELLEELVKKSQNAYDLARYAILLFEGDEPLKKIKTKPSVS